MRGGVSESGTPTTCEKSSSPHAWGCFQQLVALLFQSSVFPTCVGVFLTPADWAICKRRLPHMRGGGVLAELCLTITISGLPHMRGGVSSVTLKISVSSWSSPHVWGYFLSKGILTETLLVFPTCVGVFLGVRPGKRAGERLPHMRGGVSSSCVSGFGSILSSPHAWRCFRLSSDDKSRLCAFLR